MSDRLLILAGLTLYRLLLPRWKTTQRTAQDEPQSGDNRGPHPPCDMPRSERCRIRGNCLHGIALPSMAQAPSRRRSAWRWSTRPARPERALEGGLSPSGDPWRVCARTLTKLLAHAECPSPRRARRNAGRNLVPGRGLHLSEKRPTLLWSGAGCALAIQPTWGSAFIGLTFADRCGGSNAHCNSPVNHLGAAGNWCG